MSEGHSAKVTLDGDAAGLDRAARLGRDSLGRFVAGAKQAETGARSLADAVRFGEGSIENFANKAKAAWGVLSSGVAAMDRIIMAQTRYSALLSNVPFSIDKATSATQGYIAQTKLLEAASAANRGGFIKDADVFAKYAANVQKLAFTTGEDATVAMETLTKALAKQETELLDNYNINLKVEQARSMLADQLGKTTKALTEEEKANAFAIIGMQKIEEIANSATGEIDDFAATWMKLKAVITDFPKLMNDVSNAIADAGLELDRFITRWHDNIWGDVQVMQMGRGGQGALGGQFRKAMPAFNAKGLVDPGGANAAVKEWSDRQFEYGKALGEVTTKRLTQELESAYMDSLYGKKSAHKKKQEEVILIYDNFWEEVQKEIHLKAAESQVQMANVAARVASGETKTIDPFAADPSAAFKRESATAGKLREIEMQRASGAITELERIEEEKTARLALIDVQEQAANSEMEILQAREERREVTHQAELARIEEENKARQKYVAIATQATTQLVTGVLSMTDARRAARNAALAQGKTEAEASKAAKIAGREALASQLTSLRNLAVVKVIEQTAEGIGALASFNYPGAALHFAAAATWGVVAGGAGAAANRVSADVTSMQRADSLKAAQSKGSGGGGLEGGRSGTMPRGSDSPIPGSPGPSAPSAGGGSSSGAGNKTIVITGPVHLYGTPHRDFIRTIDEGLEDLSHNRRRRSA